MSCLWYEEPSLWYNGKQRGARTARRVLHFQSFGRTEHDRGCCDYTGPSRSRRSRDNGTSYLGASASIINVGGIDSQAAYAGIPCNGERLFR